MASTTNENETSSWLDGRVRLVVVPRFDDVRGSLVPMAFEQLPFPPARMFTVTGVPVGTVRGGHALRQQQQVLVCSAGCIEVETRLGEEVEYITLDRPEVGLFVDAGVWCSQRFLVEGSILMVLASGSYDPDGYDDEVPGLVAE